MNLKNISKKIIICFICFSLCFSTVQVPVYATGAAVAGAVDQFLQGIVLQKIWDVGTDAVSSVVEKVENWFSGHKSYYNQWHGGGGHRREPKYYSNNRPLSNAMNNYYTDNSINDDSITDDSITDNSVTNNQQFIDNSTSNQYTYTSYDDSVSSVSSRTFSLVQDSYNIETNTYNTLIYNPVTNNYTTVNNISYNNQYDTYNITNNEYNFYVTNNYTYVSYYIINNETNEQSYYEIYYEMPDGRNSYDLEKEDIWGEYFVYDIANYELVAEDDGTTLALYHFDGNLKDSSYWTNQDGAGGGGSYYDSRFGSGYLVNSETNFYLPESFDINNFTLEFVMSVTVNSQYSSYVVPTFSYLGENYILDADTKSLVSGTYYIVIQSNSGKLSAYVNGSRHDPVTYTASSGSYSNSPIMLSLNSEGSFCFYEVGGTYYISSTYTWSPFWNNYILDEVRMSNCALYSGDSISVPSQPFDTNMVLAVPENPTESMIAIRGNYEIANCRIGGVRPTYPSLGDVYIYLEDDIVKDVQQYEGDAWYSVSGAIYTNGEWSDLSGYSMASLTFEEEEDSGSSDSSGSGSDSDSDTSGDTVSGNGSDGSGLGDLIDGISKILDAILSLIGKLMGVVADFAQSILDLFSGFTTFTDGFSDFLSGAFGFIPADIWNVIKVGLSLMVLLAVIKFLRK